ncbi:phosphatidylinositol-3,5-bisphosphate 3-phosphatase [Aureococcus anophagefferens]|nr:phosphatidylinositol-3,5-bisphosphate 3-phosphatase [Aureococcus anophagefferens]
MLSPERVRAEHSRRRPGPAPAGRRVPDHAGFARLVEKDFVAFGHPFATRLAHGRERGGDRGADDQAAPILVQFLDAAFQLTALFPEHFEFGSAYLVAVADAAHGCRFGTFLFDTEGDREAHAPHAPSLWAYLDHNRAHFASGVPPPARTSRRADDALAAAEEEARFWKKRADVAGQRADRSRLFNMLVDPDA